VERQAVGKAQKSPVGAGHGPAQSARSVTRHPLIELQQSIGNQAVQRLINSPYIQAKLQVSTPGDPFEQEADRVADTVMRMPEPATTRPLIQRVPLAVRESDDDEEVQRQAGETSVPTVTNSIAANIDAMNGGGSPLPERTRSFFESRFGTDFGGVRVHTDSRAAETSRSINAKAFTVGQNIAFSPGLYAPHSHQGQQLLAHELTHVVQQSGTQHRVQRSPDPPPFGPPPPPGGGGAPPASGRVVYIDANVIIQINRGNTNVANALRAMRAAGVDVRIAPYQYGELVRNPDIPRTATAQRLMLEEMNIRPGASPSLMQRVDVNLAGQTRSGSNIMQPADQQLVASARADGRNVEIWSLDTPFTSNARQVEGTYGVRVAPESQIRLARGQADYRVGRSLLGLDPVEISLTGQVTRGTPPGGGGGGGTPPPGRPPTPPAPGTTGAGASTGTRVVAGGLAIIVVVNEILGGINRARGIQQHNIDMGNASIVFWERFGARPKSAVWDLHGKHPLPPGSVASTSVFGSPSFPYVVDIDVNALRNNLASNINSYQDFLYFLDAGKVLGNIEEDPPMPEYPNRIQRAEERRYFAWVNQPDRGNAKVYDITDIITQVRNAALGELGHSMRQQTAALSSEQLGNIYRLRRGADTEIYRSAGGRQRIITAQQLLGPDPWVRTLGRREDVGGWFSTDMRVLVVPANADAQRAALISGYWVKQPIEDTLEEVKESGRPILDKQPPRGVLNSFVAGPEAGANSRFGETRYYRPTDPDMRWTIALGELRQFWVKASDLAPVTPGELSTYTRGND